MLVGYVSDEDYVALPGVALEFERGNQSLASISRASGAVHADISDGKWRVTLAKSGFTGKHVDVIVSESEPLSFRLLSDRMYGFMWPKWVRAGETAEFCVHSTKEFRLDLWRYGWEKEWVAGFGWCDEHGPKAMAQLLPDNDFTQTGVNWNRVGYSLQYQKHAIQAPQRSGLYFLHALTREGDFCSFPWLISPREPCARIAVLSSTLTQNAYNRFGGRSNYFNQDGLPPRPIVNSRQDLGRYAQPDVWPFDETGAPLSFQRPEPASCVPQDANITDTVAGRVESLFAPGEWRLLGWLEREGFRHDLYSDTDLHFDRLPLDAYDVLILNLHPEYWSAEMHARVKRWVREQGGKLLYLGGCAMYAEVEFQDQSTIRCRKEGEFAQRVEPPASLLGVAYTHAGFQTAAPYQVIDAEHWVYKNSGLSNGDLFGLTSLHERCPGGASAHELDTICADSPKNLRRLAKGANPDGAGADLIIYETESGGGVFATGSLCWTLSLPVDGHTSALTRNVLHRFLEGKT